MAVTVNQEFSEEATVAVWRNIKKGFIPTGHFGHAAVFLRGATMGLGLGEYEYISWWPGEGAGKEDALRNQAGSASESYFADMASEMSPRAQQALRSGRYAPRGNQHEISANLQADGFDLDDDMYGVEADVLVSVPGLGAATSTFGLHLPRMWQWYRDYQDNGGTYTLASRTRSCAGIAAVALVEGGGEAFVSAPTALIYMEPRQVEDYAKSLKREIAAFNHKIPAFRTDATTVTQNALRGTTGVTGFAKATDLWSHDEWKKRSALSGKIRSGTIRSIDSALEAYHRVTWASDYTKKYKSFVEVLRKCMQHRVENPTSERKLAVCQLGLQCLDVIGA